MYDFCLTLPYGMMLGLGGLIGFVNSGSVMSAVAGIGSGAFLSFVGYCSYNEYTQSPVTSKLWPALSLGVSGALSVVMGMRYNKTGAFMPAGLVCSSSVAMSVFYIWILTKTTKPQYKKSN